MRINDTAEDFEIRLPALCDDSLFAIAPLYAAEVFSDVQIVIVHFQQGPHLLGCGLVAQVGSERVYANRII